MSLSMTEKPAYFKNMPANTPKQKLDVFCENFCKKLPINVVIEVGCKYLIFEYLVLSFEMKVCVISFATNRNNMNKILALIPRVSSKVADVVVDDSDIFIVFGNFSMFYLKLTKNLNLLVILIIFPSSSKFLEFDQNKKVCCFEFFPLL